MSDVKVVSFYTSSFIWPILIVNLTFMSRRIIWVLRLIEVLGSTSKRWPDVNGRPGIKRQSTLNFKWISPHNMIVFLIHEFSLETNVFNLTDDDLKPSWLPFDVGTGRKEGVGPEINEWRPRRVRTRPPWRGGPTTADGPLQFSSSGRSSKEVSMSWTRVCLHRAVIQIFGF